MNIGIIILSAGNSSRLGSPKQLLAYKDSSLLQHTIAAAEATPFAPIVMVLGAYAADILKETPYLKINCATNENWEQGISSSIAVGLKKILELEPDLSGVILAVSDQPHISAAAFNNLTEKSTQSGKGIVASSYAGTTGTPALFNKKYFDELLNLEGHTGAKPILQKYTEDVAMVDFELGNIDIDTEIDYNKLISAE